MIYKATQEIANVLAEKGLNYDILEGNDVSRVICDVKGSAFAYRIQFISLDDDSDMAVRVFDLVRSPKEKQETMILFANNCNKKCRYLKFTVSDNAMNIEFDCPNSCVDIGNLAVELLARIMKIVNEVGSDLMRQIWA